MTTLMKGLNNHTLQVWLHTCAMWKLSSQVSLWKKNEMKQVDEEEMDEEVKGKETRTKHVSINHWFWWSWDQISAERMFATFPVRSDCIGCMCISYLLFFHRTALLMKTLCDVDEMCWWRDERWQISSDFHSRFPSVMFVLHAVISLFIQISSDLLISFEL